MSKVGDLESLPQPVLGTLPQLLSNDTKSLTKVIEYMLQSNGGAYFLPTTEAALQSLPGAGLPRIEVVQSFKVITGSLEVGISSGASIWSDLLAIVYRGRSGDIWEELRTLSWNAEQVREIWLQAGNLQNSCDRLAKAVKESFDQKADVPSAQKVLAASVKLISDTQSFRKLLTEYNAAGRMTSEDMGHWMQSMKNVHTKFDTELTTFRRSLWELPQGFKGPEQSRPIKKHYATMESLKRRIVNTTLAVDQISDQMPKLDSFATACGTWVAQIDPWVLDVCGSIMCGEAAEACLICEERHNLLIEESAVSSIAKATIQAPTDYLEVETIMLGNENIL